MENSAHKKELDGKKDRFFAAMEKDGVDGYWVVKPENIRYLTGFHGEDSTLLVGGRGYCLVTDRRYAEEAESCIFADEVKMREGPMAAAAGRLGRRLGIKKLAMTAANVNCADYKDIADTGGMKVSLRRSGIVEELRIRKTPWEIDQIKHCTALAENALRKFVKTIKEGNSELDMASDLEWHLRRIGAEKASFATICAIAENGSKPHAGPSDRKLSSGENMILDWGAHLNGYNSDLTRVIALGTIPGEVVEVSDAVLAAQEKAFEVLGPGIEASEVDRAARQVLEDRGYGRCFLHGLGHGIGLEVHEKPALAPGRDICLEPGMVMTIEPAVYISGKFGVRIEDMVHITENGFEKISGLERRPICL